MIFPSPFISNITAISCTPIPCPRGEIFAIGLFVGIAVTISMGLAAYMIWRVKEKDAEKPDEPEGE